MVRVQRLLVGVLCLAATSCTDGTLVSDQPAFRFTAPISIAPIVPRVAFLAQANPINAIRITVVSIATGQTVAQQTLDVDPDAEQWSISVEVEFAESDNEVNILLELIHVPTAGTPLVEWSAQTGTIHLQPGIAAGVQRPTVYRGPLANLGVTSITLEGPSTVLQGETFPLVATPVVTGNAGDPVVFYTIDDLSVVSFQNGVFLAEGPGTATITAQAGSVSAAHQVLVIGTPNAVVVSPPTGVAEAVGDEVQFSAQVVDSRGSPLPGENIEWSVDETGVAEHLGSGLFRALAAGSATIRATSVADPDLSGTATLTVDPRATSLSASPESARMLVGATVLIEVSGTDRNGNSVQTPQVTFASSDESVATVDADGLVTGVSPGATEITVSGQSGADTRVGIEVVLISTDLGLTGSTERTTPSSGEVVPVEFVLANLSDEDATEIVVQVETTEGAAIQAGTPDTGAFDAETGIWTLDALQAGSSGTLPLEIAVEGDPSTRLVVSALLTGLVESDSDPDNDQASVELVINAPPVADDQSVSMPRGEGLGIRLTGTDPEGGALVFEITGQPGHGTLTALTSDNRTVYVPDDGFVGDDSFVFTVTDPEGASASGTVSVTVTPPPPAASLRLGYDVVLNIGETTQTEVRAFDSAGRPITAPEVTYVSTAPAVATVSPTGLVTAVSAGVAQIEATSGTHTARVNIGVAGPGDPVAWIEVDGQSPNAVPLGQTFTVDVIVDMSRIAADGDIGAVQFDLTYDPYSIEYVDAAVPLAGVTADYNDDGAGLFRYVMVATAATADPLVTLATITFRVSGDATEGATAQLLLDFLSPLSRTDFSEVDVAFALPGRVRIIR